MPFLIFYLSEILPHQIVFKLVSHDPIHISGAKILSKSFKLWGSWKYLFKIDNTSLSCDCIISMHLTANRRKIQTTSQYIYHGPFQQI